MSNTAMSYDEREALLEEIGRVGDALWDGQIRDSVNGRYVPIEPDDQPDFSLCHRAWKNWQATGDSGGLSAAMWVAWMHVLAPLDLVQIAVRAGVYAGAELLWQGEKFWAGLQGRSWFCPLCHNPMGEPLVSCPDCGGVLPRLRPSLSRPLYRQCPHCGKSWWPTAGALLSRPPAAERLVCRDTGLFTGCYRPNRLGTLAGRSIPRHLALVGAGLPTKHLFLAAATQRLLAEGWRAAWPITQLEQKLITTWLPSALEEDTGPAETPGLRWTLGRTMMWTAPGAGRVLRVLHNLADEWIDETGPLSTNGLHWLGLTGLLFVVDPALCGPEAASHPRPQAEVYSRLLRAVESNVGLSPGEPLPFRVAVAVPRSDVSNESARSAVLAGDPAFHALLTRTTRPEALGFFGGALAGASELTSAEPLAAERESWLTTALNWAWSA